MLLIIYKVSFCNNFKWIMIIRIVLLKWSMIFFIKKEILVVILIFLILLITIKISVVSMDAIELRGIMSMDFLSSSLVVLRVYVCLLRLLRSKKVVRDKIFGLLILILRLVLVLAFSVSRFFLFFFFFEAVLIPLIIIIVGWGYQPERLQASVYIFIYTVFGSLFFIFGARFMYFNGQRDRILRIYNIVVKRNTFFWWLFVLGFIIKLPVYPFHLWLPKAHVEAPVAGSIILAGVVLKLGGYGVIRLTNFVYIIRVWKIFGFLIRFSLLGGLYARLVCCRQVDLKCLVAYSSIGHMRLVMLGCLRNSIIGVKGALVVIIGHGFCSSGLFRIVNSFYLNSLSRRLFINKGLLIKIPCLTIARFLLCIGNMAAPPRLNLFGEVLLFICVLRISFVFLLVFMAIRFIRAVYSLYLYVVSCHGKIRDYFNSCRVVRYLDIFVLSCHFFPLNFLLFFFI